MGRNCNRKFTVLLVLHQVLIYHVSWSNLNTTRRMSRQSRDDSEAVVCNSGDFRAYAGKILRSYQALRHWTAAPNAFLYGY
jgi:hypothetical protein